MDSASCGGRAFNIRDTPPVRAAPTHVLREFAPINLQTIFR